HFSRNSGRKTQPAQFSPAAERMRTGHPHRGLCFPVLRCGGLIGAIGPSLTTAWDSFFFEKTAHRIFPTKRPSTFKQIWHVYISELASVRAGRGCGRAGRSRGATVAVWFRHRQPETIAIRPGGAAGGRADRR